MAPDLRRGGACLAHAWARGVRLVGAALAALAAVVPVAAPASLTALTSLTSLTAFTTVATLATTACDAEHPPHAPRPPRDVAARPNILLLVAEDLSPRIGAFGDDVAHTPHIDRLASEGTRYTHAFTTAGVCAPSRAALVTGVPAIATGAMHMRSSGGGYRAVPAPDVKAFPELLRGAGYYTFTDTKLDYQFSGVGAGSGPFTIWDDEGLGTHWRDRAEGQPFFGMINFMETHESAIFPRPAWPRSASHLVLQALQLYLHRGLEPVTSPDAVRVPPYYPDTPVVRRDLARHYDHIHRMDERVGDLVAELEADGLLEATIVVWTTDHGDGLPRAKRTLYDSGLHVPLVIRWPEALRPGDQPRGGVDARLVSFLDLAPTILAWANVEALPSMQGVRFAGAQVDPPPTYIHAARDRIDEIVDRQRAVRDLRYKYVRDHHAGEPGAQPLAFRDNQDIMRELWRLHAAGELDEAAAIWFGPMPEEALYDTQADPFELTNLAGDPEHAVTLARMRGALDAERARTPDLGEIDEATLSERFWPGGEEPVTPPPTIRFELHGGRARAVVESPLPGASIGVRLQGADTAAFALYTGPFGVDPGVTIEARAVRYGFARSDAVRATAPRLNDGDDARGAGGTDGSPP
jgi:arylsulfatase A-like enzyme